MDFRDKLIRFGVAFVFSVLAFRLAQIMVLDHREYNVLAQQQHLMQNELSANRGEIYTADGYPLVLNQEEYLMFVVPIEVEDKEDTRDQLKKAILTQVEEQVDISNRISSLKDDEIRKSMGGLDEFVFPLDLSSLKLIYEFQPKEENQEKISSSGDDEKDRKDQLKDRLEYLLDEALSQDDNQFVQLLTSLETDQMEFFEGLGIKGLHFKKMEKRDYPEGEMGAHVLGFVGKDEEGNDRGYFGLEGYYDRDLSGRSGYELLERDVIGQRIPFGIDKVREASDGRDLILTIRRELQYLLESHLARGVEKYGAVNGSAVLLDPTTGAVWAMANYPTYSPEYWPLYLGEETDVSKIDSYKNLSISSNYEPGSVMKPLTMGAALNEGVVNQNTLFNDTGPVEYSGYEVKTWNGKYHGEISMARILQLSSNTGAAWVGHQLGFVKYAEYVDRFRLGKLTGIDLEGEEAGIVRPKKEWRDIDLANMSFGQGISLTPIQLAAAFSSLVNGGELYEPYIVQHILDQRYGQPFVIERQPQKIDDVIDPEISEQLRYMLQSVVTDGEFRWFVDQADMNHYSIGGKTGTAQIPVGGRYDPHKTNTTYIGFGPVQEPKFVLLIRLNQPSTSTYSAETVVPLWMDISKELMVYFQINPDY